MKEITSFLKTLLSQPGLPGYERPVCDLIAEKWRPLVDEISVNAVGSLHGLRKAASTERRPSLMIATHMDAVGLMVKKIEHSFLQITSIGGVDPRILPGQQVTIHGKEELTGLVQMIPDRLVAADQAHKPPTFERLFIDTGLDEKTLKNWVKPGDPVSFAQSPFELEGGFLAGHSLDNRASVAALTVCLEELRNFNLAWNVLAVATVQEETGAAGARTSSFGLKPNLSVVIDVTFAKGPGPSDYRCFGLGEGPTLGTGANNHPALRDKFAGLADEMDLPFAYEAMPVSSGTDGMAIQVSANGIPNVVLGIALRYMHTTVEMVCLKDIFRTGRLLARFIAQLQPDSLDHLLGEGIS